MAVVVVLIVMIAMLVRGEGCRKLKEETTRSEGVYGIDAY